MCHCYQLWFTYDEVFSLLGTPLSLFDLDAKYDRKIFTSRILQDWLALQAHAEEVECELHDIISLCQRYQPPGSPPPGDKETFVRYVLQSLHEEVSTAKRALAEAMKGSHD